MVPSRSKQAMAMRHGSASARHDSPQLRRRIGDFHVETPRRQTRRETTMSERRFFPPLLMKALTIGAVSLLLLILIAQVEGLVGERVKVRETAAARVAESWG